jgi:hypothetical protein
VLKVLSSVVLCGSWNMGACGPEGLARKIPRWIPKADYDIYVSRWRRADGGRPW